jgi:hypothetical protein
MADDAVFVDDESCSAANEPLLVEDAVGFDHLPLDVAEQGKGHAYVFLEAVIGGVAVNADADDLRVALLEVGDISLIRLQFLRSTACEGEHVKGERNVFLATEIRKLNCLTVRVCESEIGRSVSDLELRLRSARLLRAAATAAVAANVAGAWHISGPALRLRRLLATLSANQRKNKQRRQRILQNVPHDMGLVSYCLSKYQKAVTYSRAHCFIALNKTKRL